VLDSNYPLTRGHRFYLREGMREAGTYVTMTLDPQPEYARRDVELPGRSEILMRSPGAASS
jgi:hypothetical protein